MAIGTKYADFTRFLECCGKDRISLTVDEIARIITLPSWVLDPNRTPWANTKQSFAAGWRNAGYIVVEKSNNVITFAKE